jgi:hypothetical protein
MPRSGRTGGKPLQNNELWESVPLPMWGGVWGGAKSPDFQQRKFEHQTTSTATLRFAHFSPHERRVGEHGEVEFDRNGARQLRSDLDEK